MRRGIGAKKKFGVATGGTRTQRFLMHVALEHRQTEQVWPHTADQHVVAVVQEVLHGQRGGDCCRRRLHKLNGFTCGDMFEHHF